MYTARLTVTADELREGNNVFPAIVFFSFPGNYHRHPPTKIFKHLSTFLLHAQRMLFKSLFDRSLPK